MSKDIDWKLVEGLVRQREEVLGGEAVQVFRNVKVPKKAKGTRQVDVVVLAKHGVRTLLTCVEVKHYNRPVNVTVIEQTWAKHQQLITDRVCVVSTGGFSEEARTVAEQLKVELIQLELHPSDVGARTKSWFSHEPCTVQVRFPEGTALEAQQAALVEFQSTPTTETIVVHHDGAETTLAQELSALGNRLIDENPAYRLQSVWFGAERSFEDGAWREFRLPSGVVLPNIVKFTARFRSHVENTPRPGARIRLPDGATLDAFYYVDDAGTRVESYCLMPVPPTGGPQFGEWRNFATTWTVYIPNNKAVVLPTPAELRRARM